MKRKWMIAASLPVLAVGGLLVAPSLIDWNKYKPQIIEQLDKATGHDYAINGNLDLAILPYPRVLIENMVVTQPQSEGGQMLVSMDRAAVSVALLPLLQKKVNVNSVVLDKPVINLKIDREGNPNWMTATLRDRDTQNGAAQPQGEEGSAADAISVDSIRIRGGAFSFEDARKGTPISLNDITLDIRADSLSGPFNLDGSVVYKDAKIGVGAKTGRMTKGAESFPLQANLTLPGNGDLKFSGVMGLGDVPSVQGELGFATQNLGQSVQPFMVAPASPMLQKPVAAQGILTASAESFALRNANLKWDGAEATGSITAENLKKPPLQLEIALQSDKAVNLDALLGGSAATKPTGKAAPATDAKQQAARTLLPETLSLPMPVQGNVNVTLSSVTYKNVPINNVRLVAKITERAVDASVKSVLPGDGTLDGTMKLGYGASSRAGTNGAVTLSDPVAQYRVQIDTREPQRILGAFVPAATLSKAGAVLASDLALDVKGKISPQAVEAEAGSFRIMETPLAFSGAYRPAKLAGGRDAITLNLSADQLDMDAFLARMSPDRGQKAATQAAARQGQAAKADIAGIAKNIALPFDLDLGAHVKSLRFKGNQYGNINLKGGLKDKALTIQSAGFSDEDSNNLSLKGGVADLHALSGIDLTVNAKTPDAEKVLSMVNVDTSKFTSRIGAAELLAQFKGQADRLSFTANAKMMGGSLEAAGAMADLLKTPVFSDLTARLRHPNYVDVVRFFSPNFRGSVDIRKDLDLFTAMQREGNVYNFNQLNAKIGPATIAGTVKADLSGAKPDVTANLKLGDFPIDKLLGIEAGNKRGTVQAAPRSAQTPAQTGGDSARWSRNAINTDWMHKNNLSLNATATSASYGTWAFSNADIAMNLRNGTLDISKFTGKMYGGDMAFNAKITSGATARDPLTISGKADLDRVSLQEFVSSFSGARLLRARGSVNVDADFAAIGLSPSALVFSLSGKGTATGSDLVMEGFDLARMSRTLAQPSSSGTENIQNLLGATMSGGSTAFDKLDGAFTIREGVITLSKMDLIGKDANIITTGNVNLPLWTIDMKSAVKLAEPEDAPTLDFVFRGPLDSPGQTFGRSVLDGYLRQKFVAPLQDKLQNKLQEEIGDRLNIPGLFGAAPKAAPTPTPAPAPEGQPQESQAAPQQPQQQAPATPEDALRGLLQNVIKQR